MNKRNRRGHRFYRILGATVAGADLPIQSSPFWKYRNNMRSIHWMAFTVGFSQEERSRKSHINQLRRGK